MYRVYVACTVGTDSDNPASPGSPRKLMALEEDRTTGRWAERSICMGHSSTCSFPGLINHHHKFIISFAEDEAGNHLLVKKKYLLHTE